MSDDASNDAMDDRVDENPVCDPELHHLMETMNQAGTMENKFKATAQVMKYLWREINQISGEVALQGIAVQKMGRDLDHLLQGINDGTIGLVRRATMPRVEVPKEKAAKKPSASSSKISDTVNKKPAGRHSKKVLKRPST